MLEIADVTPETFQADVLSSELPVVVDVWADWCGPCKAMLPIVKALVAEYEGRVTFVKLNGGENKDFITSLEIRTVPTFLMYHKGERKAVRGGMLNIDQMRSFINNALEQIASPAAQTLAA